MPSPHYFRASGRLVDFMRQADEPGLINLAAGVPGLDALPIPALEQATQAALQNDGARLFAYHHPEGDHALREHLAACLNRRGATLCGEQILTVTGCTQALQLLISVLVQPGDIVVVESPAYYGLLELLSEARARILPLPSGSDGSLDLAATELALRTWKPRALIVCTSLSNPSGITLPDEKRPRLVALCRAQGVRLIEDDIYGELVDTGAPPTLLTWDDGSTVSYASSFSKTVSPGLRVGVLVPGSLHEALAARKCQQDLHSSVLSEAVLREFLAADALDPHLRWLRNRNRERRELALATISTHFPPGTRVDPPHGGYMLWVEVPARCDLEKLRVRARSEKVVFALGGVFFTEKSTRNFLRLNCAKASTSELVHGLEVLGRLLQISSRD